MQQQQQQVKQQFNVSRIGVNFYPKYMLSNLCCTPNCIAYVAYSDSYKLVYERKGSAQAVNLHDTPTSINAIRLKQINFVVVTGYDSFVLFNEQCEIKLQYDEEQEGEFFIGSTVLSELEKGNDQFGIIGSSKGLLYYVDQNLKVQKGLMLGKQDVKVVCMESHECMLIVCDQEGLVHFLNGKSIKEVKYEDSLDLNTNHNPITVCRILRRKSGPALLGVGDFLGRILVVNLQSRALVTTIHGHVRVITGLSSIDSRYNYLSDWLISGSEDTYIIVWKVSEESAELVVNYHLTDQMVVGVCRQGENRVCASAYDQCELTTLDLIQ